MVFNKRFYTTIISTIVLVGITVTSFIGYFVAKNSISERLQQEMLPLTSDNIYSEIERDLLQPILISSLMSNDVFVFDWVNSGEADPTKISSYLAQIQSKYNTITAFFVSDATRRYYHPEGILKTVSETDATDEWYFNSKASNLPYQINIDTDTADKQRLSIFVNYRVVDKSDKFIGLIGVGLSLKTVVELIENYQKRYGREIYFVNRQGEVMLQSSHYSNELHMQNKVSLEKAFIKILTSPSASIRFHAKDGSTLYINSRIVPEFDWYLIVEQINDPTSENIEKALIINIALSLIVSVIVLFIANLALRGYHDRLEIMAKQDKLTGAASRQVFDSYFHHAAARAKRRNESLSLVLFDIDLFKRVNDTFGHQAGDRVLSRIAHVIQSYVRKEDILCRWGGEEFLLLLTACDLHKAFEVSEKIRIAVEELVFHFNNKEVKITLSGGIAELQYDESLTEIVERTDHLLYEAKDSGRNCMKS